MRLITSKLIAERDTDFGLLGIIANFTGTDENAVCILNIQMQVAQKAAAALMGKYGTSYKVGSTSSILCKFIFPFNCSVFQRRESFLRHRHQQVLFCQGPSLSNI